MKISDIKIPDELIAQYPFQKRDKCHLLCVDKNNSKLSHHVFSDIFSFINSGDLLVLNDSKVFNARVAAKKETGGTIELLLLSPLYSQGNDWHSIISGRNIKIGSKLFAGNSGIIIEVIEDYKDGTFVIRFPENFNVIDFTDNEGVLPLPPYIKREAEQDDYEMYQTVFAQNIGSVASPTAALHFTQELLENLRLKGVNIDYITLHVGYGTFSMVRDLDNHIMHKEIFTVNKNLEQKIKECKKNGNEVWAVGTTVIRTLESAFDEQLDLITEQGSTNLFIKPGYKFKVVDAVITNFHHPDTTLIYLVAAFAGVDNIVNAYNEAVLQKYRFLSYGDSMCIF